MNRPNEALLILWMAVAFNLPLHTNNCVVNKLGFNSYTVWNEVWSLLFHIPPFLPSFTSSFSFLLLSSTSTDNTSASISSPHRGSAQTRARSGPVTLPVAHIPLYAATVEAPLFTCHLQCCCNLRTFCENLSNQSIRKANAAAGRRVDSVEECMHSCPYKGFWHTPNKHCYVIMFRVGTLLQ